MTNPVTDTAAETPALPAEHPVMQAMRGAVDVPCPCDAVH